MNAIWLLILAGCAASPSETLLPNQSDHGKADATATIVRLNPWNPDVSMSLRCDAPEGCEGFVEAALVSPNPCVLTGDARCGTGFMPPFAFDIAYLSIASSTEGARTLPLRVQTADGMSIFSSVAMPFSAAAGELVPIGLVRTELTQNIQVQIRAEWQPRRDPGQVALETYLAGIEGLSFEEVATAYPGYRAYALRLEQPLDHRTGGGASFVQRATLHHLSRSAPTVLYTSGYELFDVEHLAELSVAMSANQISTEQRFFGTSYPANISAEDWQLVNIEQAAADHHRFVELLRPFYEGTWLSTGHSKGGMTSIYHRRFYPEDVDATVAYVAPISFAPLDPRYIPFLDQIGTDACRESIRDYQAFLLEHFDAYEARIAPMVEEAGYTYEHAGSLRASIEEALVTFEWAFWQATGVQGCSQIPSRRELEMLDDETRFHTIQSHVQFGTPDQFLASGPGPQTYNYQALFELGYQGLSRAHFGELITQEASPFFDPSGTSPMHSPDAMVDIQDWVRRGAAPATLFIYGEYDPWTGGRFEVEAGENTLSVTAPQATHAALIQSLNPGDRNLVLDRIEHAMGIRPVFETQDAAGRAPLPPGLLTEGLELERMQGDFFSLH